MVTVVREDDRVIFEIRGLHKLWALKSRLEIPWSNIRGARKDASIVHGWKGLRAPGTHVPGLITAGTFHLAGRRIFWDVCDPDKTVVVDLDDEDYSQLVIEVGDPDGVIGLLTRGKPPTAS